jgi:hypothetical protein
MRRLRPSPAIAISCLALAVALGGTGYAAVKLNGKQLVNRSVPGVKLKKDTLTKTEIKEASIASMTTVFDMRAGPFSPAPVGKFTTRGGSVLIQVSASAYRADSGLLEMNVLVDGLVRGRLRVFTNFGFSHSTLVSSAIPVTGLKAGSHTLLVKPIGSTSTDASDFLTAVVFEGAVTVGPDEFEDGDDVRAGAAHTEACAGPNGSIGSTIFPAKDDDWRYSTYSGAVPDGTITFGVVGGPTLDVYPHNGATPLATNKKTFTASANLLFYDIRIHGPKAQAYVFTCSLDL